MARVWRDGQKKMVHIYRFMTTGTIDEKIYQRQITKLGQFLFFLFPLFIYLSFILGLSRQMVDNEIEETKSSFTLEELRDIFTLNQTTASDTHDLTRCGCDEKGGECREKGTGEDEVEDAGSKPPKKGAKIKGQVMRMKHFRADFPDPAVQVPFFFLIF